MKVVKRHSSTLLGNGKDGFIKLDFYDNIGYKNQKNEITNEITTVLTLIFCKDFYD